MTEVLLMSSIIRGLSCFLFSIVTSLHEIKSEFWHIAVLNWNVDFSNTFSRSSTLFLRLCTSSVTFSSRARLPPAYHKKKSHLYIEGPVNGGGSELRTTLDLFKKNYFHLFEWVISKLQTREWTWVFRAQDGTVAKKAEIWSERGHQRKTSIHSFLLRTCIVCLSLLESSNPGAGQDTKCRQTGLNLSQMWSITETSMSWETG